MNQHRDINHAADLHGMRDAEYRHSGAMSEMEIFNQYREIQARPKSEIQPYKEPEEQPIDTGALKPAQIRGLKMFAFSGSFVAAWVGFLEVCASGALNMVFQYGACGLFLVAILSGLRGSGTGRTVGSKGGDTHHHHYYQNNSFGGRDANQNNQR